MVVLYSSRCRSKWNETSFSGADGGLKRESGRFVDISLIDLLYCAVKRLGVQAELLHSSKAHVLE